MKPLSLRDHLRAAACLLVCGAMLAVGFPGLDFMSIADVQAVAADMRRAGGAPAGAVGQGLVWMEAEVRRPLARRLRPVERLFRISHEFHLYRDGPRYVDRLEVLIDGDVVYRTGDPSRDWLGPALANRKVRPMVATAALKKNAANQRGLGRFLTARAREDFPEAAEVVIRSVRVGFGRTDEEERFRRVARAPDWVAQLETQ